jgi:uncharacterized protein (TIGR03083 family)
MAPPYTALQRGFTDQAKVVAAMVRDLEDFSAPTRLPGWSCAVLVGHLTSGIEALWRWQGESAEGRAQLDAVSYWDPAASVAEISSDWAIAYAGKRTPEDLRDELIGAIARGVTYVGQTHAASLVVPPIGSIWLSFDEFLATRVVELTVHYLDLADACGSEREPAPTAAAITSDLLDQRLIGSRPADLEEDVRWIEAATGRVPHTDDRLPVVS